MFPAIAGVPVRPRAQFSMGIIAQLRFATPALDLRSRPVWTSRGWCAVQVVEARSPCLRARALPAAAPTTPRGTAHSVRNTMGHQTASPKVDAYPQPPGPIQDRPLTLLIPAQRLGQPGGDQQRRAQHDRPGAGPQSRAERPADRGGRRPFAFRGVAQLLSRGRQHETGDQGDGHTDAEAAGVPVGQQPARRAQRQPQAAGQQHRQHRRRHRRETHQGRGRVCPVIGGELGQVVAGGRAAGGNARQPQASDRRARPDPAGPVRPSHRQGRQPTHHPDEGRREHLPRRENRAGGQRRRGRRRDRDPGDPHRHPATARREDRGPGAAGSKPPPRRALLHRHLGQLGFHGRTPVAPAGGQRRRRGRQQLRRAVQC